MSNETIVCPQCRAEFPLTEAITRKLRDDIRAEYDVQARRKEADYAVKMKKLAERERGLDADVQRRIEQALAKQKAALVKEAQESARQDSAVRLQAQEERIAAMTKQLRESQQAEVALRAQKAHLEARAQELEVEAARTIDAERAHIREDAERRFAEQHRLKDREKEKLITDLNARIDELQRKVSQGSQQAQGEVLEVDLEARLRGAFPGDVFEPVPKGMRGGDIVQTVHNQRGQACGRIIWETKRTKDWSGGWLEKLKADQHDVKAELAVLMTTVLPKELTAGFGQLDGVWVTNYAAALCLTAALRNGLIEVAHARQAAEGRRDKMGLLYDYLAGPEFKQHIEGIVASFTAMQEDLQAEKRAMVKLWAQREKQLQRMSDSTARLYGDMQGIIGGSLPHIAQLELLDLGPKASDPGSSPAGPA